jgi:hypothetical protein
MPKNSPWLLKNLLRLAEHPLWLAEKSTMAGGKHFATYGGTTFNGQRKNPQWMAEKSSTLSRNSRSGGKIPCYGL